MKKLFALLALVLGVVSCQTDQEGFGANVGGEQEVNITVALPEATRANSALGAFDNISLDNYSIHYFFQVFNADGSQKKAIQDEVTDNKSVTFPVRLIPGREYNFVVWAHLVDAHGNAHYAIQDGSLKNIVLNGDWEAMDESRDAYTGKWFGRFDGASTITIDLKRPFAKLRVVTNDMNELMGVMPTKSKVAYSTTHYNAFDALNQTPSGEMSKEHDFTAIAAYDYKDGDDTKTLFTDYFFATTDQEEINFSLTIKDQDDDEIGETIYFNTAIPVKRNTLTTIAGNILTKGDDITVTIEDAFADPSYNWPSTNAEQLAYAAMFGGKVTLTENTTLTQGLQVVTSMVIDLNGYTLNYTGDDVLFRVKNGATLTLNGTKANSAIVTNPTTPGNGGNGYVALVSENATLNINGGDYDAQATCTVAQVSKGTLNVYAGSFKVNMDEYTDGNGNARYLLNCSDTPYKNGEAVINVYGGTFHKFNPESNAAETANTNFCADGHYAVDLGNSTYRVFSNETPGINNVVATVDEVLAAFATNNAVIYMENGNYIATKKFSFGENVTVYGNGASIKNDWASYAFNKQCNLKNVKVYDVNFTNNTIFDMAYADGEVYFENCVFSHIRGNQSLHFDGKAGAKITLKNCTLYGRNMLAASLDTVEFIDCKFLESTWNTEQGNKGVGTGWSGVNMWGKYVFTNCQFDSICHCCCKCAGVEAAFIGCTYTNGDAITMDLINGDSTHIKNSTITIE